MISPQIRVLSIIHHPVYSGPHNRTSKIGRYLARHGVQTTVALPDEAAAAAERLRSEGTEVVTLPLHRLRTVPSLRVQTAWLTSIRREAAEVASLIRRHDIDVVATNGLGNVHGALAARASGAALVWQIVDTFPPAVARRAFMPIVLRSADVVMTTGVEVAKMHRGVTGLGNRWLTFTPPVDTAQFSPTAEGRRSARERLGLDADAIVVGTVGAMSPMKGHHHFIRAAAILRRHVPNTQFVILGSRHADRDKYYASLRTAADRLGLRIGRDLKIVDPMADVAHLAQALDIFWMTSEPRSEGIPTAVGEAQALGIPPVVADVGSTRECLEDGRSGFVVAPRDVAAFVSRSRQLIEDRSLYVSMSTTARTSAADTFDVAQSAERHLLAYQTALEHRRHRRRVRTSGRHR